MNKLQWDDYFMTMAYFIAMKSKDPNTKIGSVIVTHDNEVVSTGYNGLPRGVNDDCVYRNIKPEKTFWYTHSELNSILNAARIGVPTKMCRLFTLAMPCCNCAQAIVQAGINEVCYDDRFELSEHWIESSKRSLVMFNEAGINITKFQGKVINKIVGWKNGKEFEV